MRRWRAMFRIGCWRDRMSGTVEFRAQAEEEANCDKDEDPLLFRRKHNSAQAVMLTSQREEGSGLWWGNPIFRAAW
jgi:hypothetical protein